MCSIISDPHSTICKIRFNRRLTQSMDLQSGPAPSEPLPPEPETFSIRAKKALGPVAVVGVVVAKFFAKMKFFILPALKFLPIILKSGGTMLLMMWVYTQLWGWKFAVGFVILLLVHECGHLLVAKKFGLKVGAPVFIPFMGAFIALKEAPRNAWMESCVGIGGPLLGPVAAPACTGFCEPFAGPGLTGWG